MGLPVPLVPAPVGPRHLPMPGQLTLYVIPLVLSTAGPRLHPEPGFGSKVKGCRFKVQGSGLKVQGSGFRVQGSGFRVQGWGFRDAPVLLVLAVLAFVHGPVWPQIHLREEHRA